MVSFNRVDTENEVSINSKRYRLAEPVRTILSSQYPQRQITGTGEITSDSDPTNSVHTWSDPRGGIGVDRMILGEDARRSWFSTCVTSLRNHLMKGPLATETAAPSGGPTGIVLISELGGNVVAAYGTDVRDLVGATWNASARVTLTAAPTDVLNLTTSLSTSETLVFASTGQYQYSSSIASWSNSTKDVVKMAVWDNRLWGIDATGQLWYTYTIGSNEKNNAKLNLAQNDVITGLFVGRDANGNTVLSCSTERYLYQHDIENCRFGRTLVSIVPEGLASTNHTRKATSFQDQTYLASSSGVINYLARAGEATIQDMGFDEDDGLPSAEWEQKISCMAESTKELIVGGNPLTSSDTGLILAWNPLFRAWRVLWQATSANTAIESLHVIRVTNHRLYFGYQNRVWFLRLNETGSNPKQIAGWEFTATDDIDKTPWFDAGQHEVDLTAVELILDIEDASSNETVKVEYATDYTEGASDASYTTLATITADGRRVLTFPDDGTSVNAGKDFRAIRVKRTLARGGTTTNSPDVTSMVLIYRKKLRPKWMHTFVLDLTQDGPDGDPKTQRADLTTAIQLTTFVEVVFRDDSGNTRNIYADLVAPDLEESTGSNETGTIRITAVEKLAGAL